MVAGDEVCRFPILALELQERDWVQLPQFCEVFPPPRFLYTAVLKMVYPQASGIPMQMRATHGLSSAPAAKRWSRSRARIICPRKHLRVLPTRTRPSCFGGD